MSAIACKVILPKIVLDFTVGRLSENVKILLWWIYDFCLQQIYTIGVKPGFHFTANATTMTQKQSDY